MIWMSGWLKTVITVILLATFVDLLLPSSTMQRYVRTVMSLFVLLTLLTPLVELIQRNWQPEQLFSMVEGEQAKMAAAQGIGSMPSLQAIQQKADQIKATNARQEKSLVETQLASQIREQLKGETALQVTGVSVNTAVDKQNKPFIQEVHVTLGPAARQAASTDNTGTDMGSDDLSKKPLQIEIKPVDPMHIRIGDTDSNRSAPVSTDGLPPEYREDKVKIDRLLGKEWQLPADHIEVDYQPDAASS